MTDIEPEPETKRNAVDVIAPCFLFRRMVPRDLLLCNNVNLDYYTDNFNAAFYMDYLTRWPELCIVAESPDGCIAGYVIGKVEGTGRNWHGHVTAISVAPQYRRSDVATELVKRLQDVSEAYRCYFIDLFVRETNKSAIKFYQRLGYTTYRVVPKYYTGVNPEDAWEMRKPLS